jgi:small subunit ribosomal protein S17
MTADMQSSGTAGTRAEARRPRATRTGVVTSTARQKTIAVTVSFVVMHPKYGKYVRRRTVLHVHDEQGACRKGDVVEIAETRPISKTKRWRLVRLIGRAPGEKRGDA